MSDGWTRGTMKTALGSVTYLKRDLPGGVEEYVYPEGGYEVTRVSSAPPQLRYDDARDGRRAQGVRSVTFSAKALETIRHHAAWVTGSDGLEVGGFLEGRVVGGRIEVERAYEATKSRSANSLQLDSGRRSGYIDDLELVGDWHTHPGSDARSSDSDERGWRARASPGDPGPA